jgi:hemerythrin-like metal-binding protein
MMVATKLAVPKAVTLTSGYQIGHAVLDQQHAELLMLINQLSACMASNSSKRSEEFHSILNDLMDLTRAHFYAEESFLGRQGDLLASKHQADCEEYEERLTNILYSATFGVIDEMSLCQYLSDWWHEHIKKMAMQQHGASAE